MENINNKGVTLVETVVAIAVIVILSVAGYTICNFAILNQQKTNRDNFFINETSNILICYYSEGNFSDKMQFLTGDLTTNFNEDFILYYDKDYSYTDFNLAVYYLTFDFDVGIGVYKANDNTLFYEVEV